MITAIFSIPLFLQNSVVISIPPSCSGYICHWIVIIGNPLMLVKIQLSLVSSHVGQDTFVIGIPPSLVRVHLSLVSPHVGQDIVVIDIPSFDQYTFVTGVSSPPRIDFLADSQNMGVWMFCTLILLSGFSLPVNWKCWKVI